MVGTILTLINQLDVILRGDATSITWVKAGSTIAFRSWSNLGLLAGKRAELEGAPPEDRA